MDYNMLQSQTLILTQTIRLTRNFIALIIDAECKVIRRRTSTR